jgi:hypothetical protein
MRVLAVVSRFKWSHIDYLHALAGVVDLDVAWSGEGHGGAVARALEEGLPLEPIGRVADDGAEAVRSRLASRVDAFGPDLVHVLYYHHEELVLLAREIIGERAALLVEIRDPLTVLRHAAPSWPEWELERAALEATDAQVLVTRATRDYLDAAHGLDLEPTSLVVPHCFAARNIGPPSERLSARDGRVHLALVGTAADRPNHSRWYVDIIRRLVDHGLVVHSRFFELEGVSLDPYRRLADELHDYHFEPAIPFRWGTLLAEATSQYDLMGIFHELDAEFHNEAPTLAMCLPTKAVSGWLHGGIPSVCSHHYRGIVELAEEHGIGFVADSPEEVAHVAADRDAIERATAATLAVRERFSHEYQAARLASFYRKVLAPAGAGAP